MGDEGFPPRRIDFSPQKLIYKKKGSFRFLNSLGDKGFEPPTI